jgi:hypothetical protein
VAVSDLQGQRYCGLPFPRRSRDLLVRGSALTRGCSAEPRWPRLHCLDGGSDLLEAQRLMNTMRADEFLPPMDRTNVRLSSPRGISRRAVNLRLYTLRVRAASLCYRAAVETYRLSVEGSCARHVNPQLLGPATEGGAPFDPPMARASARNVQPALSDDPRDKLAAALNWHYGRLRESATYQRVPIYFNAVLAALAR